MQYINMRSVLILFLIAMAAWAFGFKDVELITADTGKWVLFGVVALAIVGWCSKNKQPKP